MTLSTKELIDKAEVDTEMDKNKLDRYSLALPRLSSNWATLLLEEKLVFDSNTSLYATLKKEKYELYRYNYKYTVEARGGEAQMYLDADPELSILKDAVALSKQKILFIEGIIKVLNSAGFNIKNSIEFNKFMAGGY